VAYRVQASFLPGSTPIQAKIRDLMRAELDLSRPTMLEANAVFIIPLLESLALPKDISAKANPKSTTGRLDIFTRLITDGGRAFEEVRPGYSGDLYVEVVSRTFPIVVRAGAKLNQLRFERGNPQFSANFLEQLARKRQLVYYENGDGQTNPFSDKRIRVVRYSNGDNSTHAGIDEGLLMSIDLEGDDKESIVAYRAKKNPPPVDLSKVGAHDAAEFWDAISRPQSKRLILNPSDFYLLASKERFSVPPDCAAEMTQFDPSMGEFSVHYAGFFDPGFGYGMNGEIKGTRAVLEVRAHEVPMLLEDAQTVGQLIYQRMANTPNNLYGQAIGSSYQQQGLALSKQFKAAESARSAVPKP